MNNVQKTILMTGATGLVGKAISRELIKAGMEVYAILRPSSKAHRLEAGVKPLYMEVLHYKETDVARLEALGRIDAVLHLAGESIMGVWTSAKRQRLYDSRVLLTRQLGELLCALESPPKTFISASAIGIYGVHQGEALLDEDAFQGDDFLAELCKGWEEATHIVGHAGIRCVQFRLGVVLSKEGGALAAMLPPFQWGLGGPLGNGTQWMSWIHIKDVVRAFIYAVEQSALEGAYNLTAPSPVRNKEFTTLLGKTLERPTPFPVPEILLKWALRDLADSLLLASQRVSSEALEKQGFVFQYPELPLALEDLIHKQEAK